MRTKTSVNNLKFWLFYILPVNLLQLKMVSWTRSNWFLNVLVIYSAQTCMNVLVHKLTIWSPSDDGIPRCIYSALELIFSLALWIQSMINICRFYVSVILTVWVFQLLQILKSEKCQQKAQNRCVCVCERERKRERYWIQYASVWVKRT